MAIIPACLVGETGSIPVRFANWKVPQRKRTARLRAAVGG